MIIRREVINFGIMTKHFELLGESSEFKEGEIIDEYLMDLETNPLLAPKHRLT